MENHLNIHIVYHKHSKERQKLKFSPALEFPWPLDFIWEIQAEEAASINYD